MASRKSCDQAVANGLSTDIGLGLSKTKSPSRWQTIRQAHNLSGTLAINRQQNQECRRQTQNSDNLPRRGGVNVFSLNKHGMTRAVRIFSEKPESYPFTVCFYFSGTFLTHRVVLHAIKDKVYFLEEAVVTKLLFEELNVIHGARGLENRWVITLNLLEARDELLRCGLFLYGKRVKVRKYDDVLKEEWDEYLKYRQIQKALNMSQRPIEDRNNDKTIEEPKTQISEVKNVGRP